MFRKDASLFFTVYIHESVKNIQFSLRYFALKIFVNL